MMADLVIFMDVFVYIVVGFCLAFYGLTRVRRVNPPIHTVPFTDRHCATFDRC